MPVIVNRELFVVTDGLLLRFDIYVYIEWRRFVDVPADVLCAVRTWNGERNVYFTVDARCETREKEMTCFIVTFYHSRAVADGVPQNWGGYLIFNTYVLTPPSQPLMRG